MSLPSSIAVPSTLSPLRASSKWMLPWLVAVAFFMESLDTTILSTAVPKMAAALHVAPLSMKSVLASYTLSLAIFIPISGWMADTWRQVGETGTYGLQGDRPSAGERASR